MSSVLPSRWKSKMFNPFTKETESFKVLRFSLPFTSTLYNYVIYQSFYSRLCPYLCGMMTAYVLHRNQGAVLRIPKYLNTTLWVSSIIIIFGVIISTFPFHGEFVPPSSFINSITKAASHLGWSVSIAWIILAAKSSGGFVNS